MPPAGKAKNYLPQPVIVLPRAKGALHQVVVLKERSCCEMSTKSTFTISLLALLSLSSFCFSTCNGSSGPDSGGFPVQCFSYVVVSNYHGRLGTEPLVEYVRKCTFVLQWFACAWFGRNSSDTHRAQSLMQTLHLSFCVCVHVRVCVVRHFRQACVCRVQTRDV